MTEERPLKIAVIAGEESGDLLGADIVRALQAATGREVRLVGVGGRHLQALGLKPLFDANEIALMGFSAVVRDLPRLLRRIGQTARAIAAEAPDCLITIDSPDFTLRVARKVRARNPGDPDRPLRLPERLGVAAGQGARDEALCRPHPLHPAVRGRRTAPAGRSARHLCRPSADQRSGYPFGGACPGARPRSLRRAAKRPCSCCRARAGARSAGCIEPFGQTVAALKARGHRLRLILPTVPHVAELVAASVAGWEQKPEIVTDAAGKWRAFGEADAALIASGTVSLELALAGVPLVSCYRLDPFARMVQSLVTVWSALLPNLIADRPVAPEFYDGYVRPETLARTLEALFDDTALRAWQKDGFAEVSRRMATSRPSGEIAAEVVLSHIKVVNSE